MASTKARYFDGQSARPREAIVSTIGSGLDILVETDRGNEPQFWATADIRFVDAADHGESKTFTNIKIPMSRLVMASPAEAVRLGRRLGVVHQQAVRVSLRARTILILIPAALAVGVLLWVGIPWVSAQIAPHLPYSWRYGLGRYVVKAVTAGDKFCVAAPGRKALDTIVSRMVEVSGHREPVHVEVTATDMINAITTPGGSIVIFSGLLKDAESPEELAGVIGHEFGHAIKEHPTDGVVRGMGVGLAMSIIFGGSDGGLATMVATMHALSYSRHDEREADATAADLLTKMNVDPKALASFFARMQKEEEKVGGSGMGIFNYLSTHPPSAERVAAAQARPAPAETAPLLTDAAWQDLKAICDETGRSELR